MKTFSSWPRRGRSFVYFFLVLAGCAYGKISGDAFDENDSGTIKAGAVKDAGTPKKADAQVAIDASQDPPDVVVQTQCDPLPLATGLAECDTCLGSSCCAEDQACGNDQDCMAFINCVNVCVPEDGGEPDQACYGNCETEYPNGENELDSLDECMQNDCSTTCFQ